MTMKPWSEEEWGRIALNRVDRLKRLLLLNSPTIILANELRLVEIALTNLFKEHGLDLSEEMKRAAKDDQ